MLDGLCLAETTPGPLILVVQFVGFLAAFRHAGTLDPLLAGCLGAALTLWVTFAPCFLWIFLGAPYVEALRGRARLDAALTAVTAAVTGVILNLAVWFALHVLFGEVVELRAFGMAPDLPVLATIDLRALLLSAAAGLMMLRFHLGMIPTLAASAAAGLLISLLS
jgi:chromate transporter